MKLFLQILLGWVALSFLVAVTVGKAIKTYQESSGRKEPVLRVVRENQAPRAIRD